MIGVDVGTIEDNIILHDICYQVAQEHCNTRVIGADLLYSIVHDIDYDLLNSITYLFISKRNFDNLKSEVVNRYQRAVKH